MQTLRCIGCWKDCHFDQINENETSAVAPKEVASVKGFCLRRKHFGLEVICVTSLHNPVPELVTGLQVQSWGGRENVFLSWIRRS